MRRSGADDYEGEKPMIRESEGLPRWLQRRENRRSGRYNGDKVVRWIARRNLKLRGAASSGEASASAEWSRMPGYNGLRLVSDN